MPKDILIGIDAGTSVIKSVAFDLAGRQIAVASTPNNYTTTAGGAAFQPLSDTWRDCVKTIIDLGDKVPDLAARTAALSVTGQGDGTWLVGKDNDPVTDAWLWLDARSSPTVDRLSALKSDRARFEITGTGLNCCQMGSQLAHMVATEPDLINAAEVSLHAKDWLYLNLTGERVTDPSEACFTFGNFTTRDYDDVVIEALGLTEQRQLLPPIIDGTKSNHPLTAQAARDTGLAQGTPVVLGFVDVVCTSLGAGIYTGEEDVGCTILGSTGMHMKARKSQNVVLNEESTGYVMVLPIPNLVAQLQTNMAATLNIDWLLKLAAELVSDLGQETEFNQLIEHINRWLAASNPASVMYHPYISEAGERGPFVNSGARASFMGLSSKHRFPDLVRAVVEGLGMASRDCYAAMGDLPSEVRVSGGAVKSQALRNIVSSTLNTPIRCSSRDEAGAAGAAMMAAVSVGAYDDMNSCIADWVSPMLSEIEQPDPSLVKSYDALFSTYHAQRLASEPTWKQLAMLQERKGA